jgi:hypothetical protein
VAFASFGIFYDRLEYNATLDETYRRQHPNYDVFFAADNTTPGRVQWDPKYFSRDGLKTLITAISPPQEVFLIPNDLKPPRSNQWSAGLRHDFGLFNGSLAYSGTRGYNGFSFEWANVTYNAARNDCCDVQNVPAYQNVLVGNNSVRTWYDALLVRLDRPYRSEGKWGWGAGLAYTLSKAEAEGGDLFSFPQVSVGLNKRHPIADDRRHQFVVNWISDVPLAWGLQFSGLAQFASGVPFAWKEFIPLPAPATGNQQIVLGYERAPWFKQVDVRLSKNFLNFNGNQAAVTLSVFNVFNTQNLTGFDDVYRRPVDGVVEVNPNFGHASGMYSDPRRFQLGLQYDFGGARAPSSR